MSLLDEPQLDEDEEGKDDREFKVIIRGQEQLHQRLEDFKHACSEHEKHMRRRCKRRYYNLGLMARIVGDTTDDELRRLLKNNARTFLFDTVTCKPKEFQELLKRTYDAMDEFQRDEPHVKLIVGIALEIHGDCCRLGRLRNNCSILLQRSDIITLTTDVTYKYSSFRQIAYVINLKYYIRSLHINDFIIMGREVRGKVIKILRNNIALMIEDSGLLNSYEYIELPNQCYSLKPEVYPELYKEDLEIAQSLGANYLVLPKIRCKPFLRTLRATVTEKHDFRIIGALDLDFVSRKMLDLMGIVKLLDYVWVPDMFSVNELLENLLNQDVIPISKCLRKPIIGTIPLERCSDFKHFENHEFLWKIDAMFIEKSSWCNKYPLIVKKLLPIRNFRVGVVENSMVLKSILTSYQSVINFIIRTISTIECHAILMYSKCSNAAEALARTEIYCPVYVILPLDEDPEKPEGDQCKMILARSLNLRRNTRSVIYTKDLNDCEYKPIDFGVDYMRKAGLAQTGDFLITIEVGKGDDDNVQYGRGDDIVILRAFYVPPVKPYEKYKYV